MTKYAKDLDQQMEHVRLSYAYVINVYLVSCNRYKRIKNKLEGMAENKYLHLIDRHFFEETDKIKWDNLLMMMPPKFDKRVWKKYDMLNENERKLCILLFFDVSCKDIADILPYTQNSVHAVTYRIKQKTGMGNIKTNLKELLFPEKTG